MASDSIGQIEEMRAEAEEKNAKAKAEKTETDIKEKGAGAERALPKLERRSKRK